jgi:hypothetical protein
MTGWLADHAEDECCDIVTVGRRSGRPHRVEIWFGVIDHVMYLISGNGPSADWYANALAAGSIEVHLHGARQGRCRAVADDEERRRVGEVLGAKYRWDGDPSIGLTRHAWCFEVPALAIEFDS